MAIDYWSLATYGLGFVGVIAIWIRINKKYSRWPSLEEFLISFAAPAGIVPALKIIYVALTDPHIKDLDLDKPILIGGGLTALYVALDSIRKIL